MTISHLKNLRSKLTKRLNGKRFGTWNERQKGGNPINLFSNSVNDIQRIRVQIEKIPSLEADSPYGSEYQLWDKAVEISVRNLFGEEGVKLFKQQESVAIPLDNQKWKQQYIGDLAKKKRVLEGLLGDTATYAELKIKEKEVSSAQPKGESLSSKFIWGFGAVIAATVIAGLILHSLFGIG